MRNGGRSITARCCALTRQILNDAQRVIAEVEDLSRGKKRMLQPLTTVLTEMASRVRQVVRQANGTSVPRG